MCPAKRGSAGDEPHGELLVSSDHQAVGPPRRVHGVKGYCAGAVEQHGEHNTGLDPGVGRPDAVVDTPSERHVAARDLPLEVDLVGSFEHGVVAIGGAPKQPDGRAGTAVDSAERLVLGYDPHVVAKWRPQAQRSLYECRKGDWVLTELSLKIRVP